MKRIMLCCFVVAWTCFAAELFLRMFDPQSLLPRYIQAGDFGIRVNIPNQTYTHTTPEYRIEIRTNAKGIRADEEFSYAKPAGVKRIVVLGDSFGMGYGVDLQDSFTEQMRRLLQIKLKQKVEIINLSSSGYGTAEELLVLQHEGIRYQPDLVLLAWHKTDAEDNLRSGLFALQNSILVRANATYLPGVKLREYLFSFSVYRWLAGNSHFYNWVRELLSETMKAVLVSMNSAAPAGSLQPDTRNYPLSLALLEAISNESKQVGAGFLMFEIPRPTPGMAYFPSLPSTLRSRFDVVSPMEQFSQKRGKMLYWEQSHWHFTPLGCKLAAEALADAIVRLDYLALQHHQSRSK